MSPSATIATVVVALVFVAWLFQSDAKDPGYEAWLRKQQEAGKIDPTQKPAAMGIAVTDAGITKDASTPVGGGGRRVDNVAGFAPSAEDTGFALTAADAAKASLTIDPVTLLPVGHQHRTPATRPAEPPKPGFGKGVKLNGTFVGVNYVGDVPTQSADAPSVTFRHDGTFATQNMAAADVDMEPGGTPVASLDRGSGRYKLFANSLELVYTDGLTRKKGPNRAYTVYPVEGPDTAPTAITIQGKVFKLDPTR
jgi:hypothetical protein